MNKTLPMLTSALLLALATQVAAQDKGKKLYCWYEGGKKVCGDALPSTAVDSARTEISVKSGLATGQVARALTDAERAAAAAAAREAEAAQFAVRAKAMREHAMAESYATEADLRRAFNERIQLLDETMKASQLGISGLRTSLISLLRQAGETELAGKPVSKALSDNIQRQHLELLRQQGLLTQQLQTRSEIDGDYAAALERYRQLKKPSARVITPIPGG